MSLQELNDTCVLISWFLFTVKRENLLIYLFLGYGRRVNVSVSLFYTLDEKLLLMLHPVQTILVILAKKISKVRTIRKEILN